VPDRQHSLLARATPSRFRSHGLIDGRPLPVYAQFIPDRHPRSGSDSARTPIDVRPPVHP